MKLPLLFAYLIMLAYLHARSLSLSLSLFLSIQVLQTAAGTCSNAKQSTVKTPVKSQSFTIRNPVSNVQLAQLDTVTTKSPRGHSGRGSRTQLNLKRNGEGIMHTISCIM